jgi:superfamily II DNA or RNA helicase
LTIRRRGWPEADLIVVDEAHSRYKTTVERIAKRDTFVIGLTATPFAKGLGQDFDAVVNVRTLDQLTDDGYLCRFRPFAPSEPSMEGAKVGRDGEWDERETEKRSLPIVGDLVTEYLRHAAGRHFIAFGVTIDHCREIQRQFLAAGVVCGLYTANTPTSERELMLRDFRPGGTMQGLVSVAALAKGFDAPWVSCVIIARPLRKSLSEHIQILGRGLRRDPENPDKECVVLDHAGNMMRFWDDMKEFFANGATTLDDGRPKEKKKPEKKEREAMKCPKCTAVHDPRPMCPHCGHEYPKRSTVDHVPGTLNELTGLPVGSGDDRQVTYSQLLCMARRRGYAEGWAAHKYRDRYGAWPDGLEKVEAEPTRKTEQWVRSQMIRFAKAREKAGAR